MPALITAATAAITAGYTAAAAAFTWKAVGTFVLKAAALIGLQFLLRKRQPDSPLGDGGGRNNTTFSSGPARWILGRARVGGVVAFANVDPDVHNTGLGRNPSHGSSDLHMVFAVSEGDCDAVEAIYIGDEKFDVAFTDEGHYARREYRNGDSQQTIDGLALLLKQDNLAYYYPAADKWLETNPYDPDLTARELDEDDEDDAEIIRRSRLSRGIAVFPYLNSDIPKPNRFRSVREYTDRDFSTPNGENNLSHTPIAVNSKWTTSHNLDGVACIHVKLRQRSSREFDRRAFRNGLPNISFLIRGVRISYPNPSDDGATLKTEWTDNAAAVRYWWYRNRLNIPAAAIDTPTFLRAFEYCNAEIDPEPPDIFPGYTDDDQRPAWASEKNLRAFRRYSINGVLASGERPSTIEAEFDDAMQGIVAEDGGKLYMYPGGVNVSEVDSIDGGDLLDYPTITPAPAITERTNAVSISIEQSSFLDFNQQAIKDIEDEDKRTAIDQDLYLPQDLGTFRWINNPAQAYYIGIINLRRARNTTTYSLRLPPGNIRRELDTGDISENDPVKYLRMNVGQIYSFTLAEENIEGKQLMLIDKQINDDMSVSATFVESPKGLYDANYDLPAIDPPPIYTPTIGKRPAKPTGLAVSSKTTIGDDGTWEFEVTASVDANPLPVRFRLIAGTANYDSPLVSDGRYVFKIIGERQQFRIQARSIDAEGSESLPLVAFHTPSYANIILPRPQWSRVLLLSPALQITFESVDYSTPISGVELRYSRSEIGQADPPDLTISNWESQGEFLEAIPIQIVRGLDLTVSALLTQSGIYKIYARFVSPISGVTKTRGPISESYRLEFEIPEQPQFTYEESPLWDGSFWNLYKYTPTEGVSKGYPMMLMAHEAPEDDPSTSSTDERKAWFDAIKVGLWNGNVSTAITDPWKPAWPFGECAGYDQALDESGRSAANDQLLSEGTSTWYRTLPRDLGTTKGVDVFVEAQSFAPGTEAISNLTFGNAAVLHQIWLSNQSIPPITLPAARSGTGAITYTIEGVPAGVTLNAARVLSGTVSVGSATGSATLIARDAGGGEARLTFTWAIINGISGPVRVNTPTISAITQTSATVSWSVVNNTSYYELSITPSGGTEQVRSNIFNTTYNLTGLTEGTQYSVKVRSVNADDTGNYSPSVTFTTDAAAVAPSNVTGLSLSINNGIRARWNAATNASTYSVRWKKTSESNYSITNIRSNITTNAYTLQAALLDPGVSYDVQVRAFNNSGMSPNWSTKQSITSAATIPSAPTISSVTDGGGDPPSVNVAVSTVTGETATIIEVNGGIHDFAEFTFTGSSPFNIINVTTGVTYTFRAKKRVAGGDTEYSAAYTYIKGAVPSQPAGIFVSFPNDRTMANLSWSKSQDSAGNDATAYRIRYWRQDIPSNISETIYTPTSSARDDATQRYTLTGLTERVGYIVEINGRNSNGDGLPKRATFTTGTTIPASPAPPVSLRAVSTGKNTAHLDWENNSLNFVNDEQLPISYEVSSSVTGFTTITGITNTHLSVSGLEADTDYTFQIRAKFTNNSLSAVATFNSISTEPESVDNRYEFPAATSLALTPRTDNRKIGYSFSVPVTGNLGYFQIRWREAETGEVPSRFRRSYLPQWHYIDIPNTFTTGTRTFTGEFDPLFSRLIYKVEFRAYLTADDSTLDGDKGFGEWKNLSRTQTIPAAELAGNLPYTITNLVYNSYNRFSPAAPTLTQVNVGNRLEVRVDWNSNRSEIENVADYAVTLTFVWVKNGVYRTRTTTSTFRDDTYTTNSIALVGLAGAVGDQVGVTVTRTTTDTSYRSIDPVLGLPQPGVPSMSATITLAQTAPTSAPDIRSASATTENEDAIITLGEVNEADGYEFTLVESKANQANTTSSRIVQTTASQIYRKRGGRNEVFSIRARAYRGSGNARVFSPNYFNYTYRGSDADAASLPKITGFRITRDADSTDASWNDISGFSNLGYQCQFSEDNGATWQTNSSQYTSSNSFSLTSSEVPLTADVQIRVRAVQGTTLSSPTNTGRSWTQGAFKAVASNENTGLGRIREIVAISRDDKIHLDWSPGTGNFSRYRLESAAPGSNSWAALATNISTSTSEWLTNQSAYADLNLRLREETDEGNGDWSYIRHTADTGVTIGAVPVIDPVGTYYSITVTWSAARNATAYDVQYRKTADSTWISHLTNHTGNRSTTISGLDDGTNYTIRIRGVDHQDPTSIGPWFSDSEPTLTCTGLSAPTFEFTLSDATMRITWTAVTNATGYKIEVSEGNTVLKTESVTGTSKEYMRSDFTDLSSGSVDVSVRMLTSIGECDGSYSAKTTKTWAGPSALSITTNTAGTRSSPHVLSGGTQNLGSIDLPESTFNKIQGNNQFASTIFRWTTPATVPSGSTYRFTFTIDAGGFDQPSLNVFQVFGDGTWYSRMDQFGFKDRTATQYITYNQIFTQYVMPNTEVDFYIFFDQGDQDNLVYPINLEITNENAGGTSGAVEGALSKGAGGATINLAPTQYEIAEDEPVNEILRPFFASSPEYQIWQTGETVDYTLPEIVGGKPPYLILVSNYPGGISFDEDTRTFSGTITNPGPDSGYCTIQLIDDNDLFDTVYLPWTVATTAQPGPQVGGGFGLLIHPYELICATKGNMRAYLGSRANGGTNAADIVNNVQHARGLVSWFQCPTRGAKFARLRNAAAPDFDLVVKIGDDFYFSDTSDTDEFIRYDDSDYVAGALIGIYKYSATTVTTGLTESSPGPIVLEWGPQIEVPTETSGAVGGAVATGEGYSNEAEAKQAPAGFDDTEYYVLWRSGTSGAWTKQAITGGDTWTPIKVAGTNNNATNVRQLRFEVHFKKWANRALQRLTTGWRNN